MEESVGNEKKWEMWLGQGFVMYFGNAISQFPDNQV